MKIMFAFFIYLQIIFISLRQRIRLINSSGGLK